MKSIKKKLIICFFLIAAICSISLIMNFQIVVHLTKEIHYKAINYKNGDIINPLKRFDFNKGNWVVYLVINKSDYENLHPIIKKTKCLKIKDVNALKNLQEKWNFVYTGGDLATVESTVYFFNNGKLVFKSGIVLDKEIVGLQNENYGWLKSQDSSEIIESCTNFKKVYSPIVFL